MKSLRVLLVLSCLVVLEAPAQQLETQQLDPQDLQRLVADGQHELAARKVVEELRHLRSIPTEAERALLQQAAGLNLTDIVAAMEQPPNNSPHEVRRTYALMLGELGKRAEALPLLRVLAAEQPADLTLRAELLLAMPFHEQLANLTLTSNGQSDEQLMRWWFSKRPNPREQAITTYLQTSELLAGFLERLDPSLAEGRDLSWVNQEAWTLAGTNNFADVGVNPLSVSPQRFSTMYGPTPGAARLEVARRLFRAMLRHDQTCQQAFQLMYACRMPLIITPEQLDQAALDALSLGMRHQSDQAGNRGRGRRDGGWSMFAENFGYQRGTVVAMDYLVQRSARDKTTNPFTEESLAGFSAANPQDAELLNALLKVVNEPGMAAFDSWRSHVMQEQISMDSQLLMLARLAIFKQRTDLLDATAELANRRVLKQRDYSEHATYQAMALPITTRDGLAAKTQAIEHRVRGLLGSPEVWKTYLETSAGRSSPDTNLRLKAFQSFGESLSSDATSSVAMARFVAKNNLGMLAPVNLQRIMTLTEGPTPDALHEWLEAGLLTFGPELVLGLTRHDSSSILETAANSLQSVYEGPRLELMNSLAQTAEPQLFAARLLQARFTKQPELAFAELEHQSKALSQWPELARADLARILRKWFGDACNTAGETTRNLLAQSQQDTLAAARNQARNYLQTGMPRGFNQRAPDIAFTSMMRCLIANDLVLATDVWLKAIDCYSVPPDGPLRGQTIETLYSSLLGSGELPFNELVAFIHQLEARRPGTINAVPWHNYSNTANNSLHAFEAQCKRNQVQTTPGLSDIPRTCADALEELARSTPQEAMPILLGLYGMADSSYLDTYVGDSLIQSTSELTEWLQGDFRQRHPELARVARLSVMTGRTVVLTDTYRKELQEDLATFLTDNQIPVGLRFATLVKVMNRPQVGTWIDTPKCSEAYARLLAQQLAADVQGLGAFVTRFANSFESSSPADAAHVLAAAQAMLRRQSNASALPIPARTLLLLAIHAEQNEEVENLMLHSAKELTGDLDLAIRLWRGNHGAMAASLIAEADAYHQQTLRDPEWADYSNDQLFFTRRTETSLPDWLETIKDPSQRFRVECLICAARDATGAQAPVQPLRKRLAALVTRFPNEAPQSRSARNEVLLAVGSEGTVAAPLAKDYVEAVGQRTFASLAVSSQGVTNPKVENVMIRRAMQFTLEETGDAWLFVRQVEAICATVTGREPTRDQKDQAYEALRNWLAQYSALLLRRMVELPPDQRAQLAEQALRVAKSLMVLGHSNLYDLAATLAIASQAAAGDGGAVERWAESLSPDLNKYVLSFGLGYGMTNLHQPPLMNEEFRHSRRALLLAILNDAGTTARALANMGENDTSDINHYVSTFRVRPESGGLFDPSDIIAVIDVIPDTNPYRAEFLIMKAEVMKSQGAAPEDMINVYELAQTVAGKDARMNDVVRVYRAHYLAAKAGSMEDAVTLAKQVNPDHLTANQKTRLQWIFDHANKGKMPDEPKKN
jgi:hypothetical protein